jgi:hypothetical protein
VNHWKPDLDGETYTCCENHQGQAKFLIDQTTNRRYLNESKGTVGFKCFLLALGTPFVQSISSIVYVVYRILKLISLSHFWIGKNEEANSSFKARLADAGEDLLKIVAAPVSILGLELAAIYGWFRPYDGRKLYASMERAIYGHSILAPCFQPDPTHHAFGGDINRKDAF